MIPYSARPALSGRIGVMDRRQPDCETKVSILIAQRGCCLYCFIPLDEVVYRYGEPEYIRLEWDHMVPYSYLRANPENNWAASCHICNGIKSDNIFDNMDECRIWIQERRECIGYGVPSPPIQYSCKPPKRLSVCELCGKLFESRRPGRKQRFCGIVCRCAFNGALSSEKRIMSGRESKPSKRRG